MTEKLKPQPRVTKELGATIARLVDLLDPLDHIEQLRVLCATAVMYGDVDDARRLLGLLEHALATEPESDEP